MELLRSLDLAAASGLARLHGCFFVVGDDGLDLVAFPDAGPGRRFPLRPGRLPDDPAARKRVKPDLESLCPGPEGGLLALGSGSTPLRRTGFFVHVAEDLSSATPVEFDLAPLYERLAARVPELNVEGAAVWGDALVLLQRGNGAGNRSALVWLDRAGVAAALRTGAPWTPALVRQVEGVELGAVGGVALGFTDAAPLPDGGLLFAAAAEDTPDTYRDGACLGSALGRLDPSGALSWLTPLPVEAKVEGVWAEAEGDHLRVWLVADADDPRLPSPLYTARLDPRSGALA